MLSLWTAAVASLYVPPDKHESRMMSPPLNDGDPSDDDHDDADDDHDDACGIEG